MTDDSFDAMRKQLGEAAQRKDRAAMARLVVGPGFFWLREGRNAANKRKSGLDNLSAALGLDNQQAAGWEILSGYAEDPTVSPSPRHDGALCAPAEPAYDLHRARGAARGDQYRRDRLGLSGVGRHRRARGAAGQRADDSTSSAFISCASCRTRRPTRRPTCASPRRSGKIGFVSIDSIAPIGNDQVCYVKDGGVWKIGGYVGGGEPQ